jgi:uncharacterized protein (UPF0147 family)
MFRKGGNVGDGIMTGIVDRENHAISDVDGVGGQTFRDEVQNRIDLINSVSGGTGLDDPLTQFLLQYGPALATERGGGSTFGNIVAAAQKPVEGLLQRQSEKRKLRTSLALEVLKDVDDKDINALKKEAQQYADEGYMGGDVNKIFKELVDKKLYQDKKMPSEVKKETQETYLASLLNNDEYLNAYTGEQIVGAIDSARQGNVPGLEADTIFYEKPYLESDIASAAETNPETGVITLSESDRDTYPSGTAIYNLRTKKWYNVQGLTLTPIEQE